MASIQNIPPPSPRKQRIRKLKRAPKDVMDWTKKQYNEQYDRWVPWLEDQYLRYFTKDNKASYATKDQLDQAKITGDSRVDKLQDNVSGTVAGQVGQGGLAQPVGDLVSKEGVNRVERGGRDDQGGYVPSAESAAGSVGGTVDKGVVQPVAGAASGVKEGAGKAGGYLGGWLGGSGGKKGDEGK